MRVALTAFTALAAVALLPTVAPTTAHADPYRWCADYRARGGSNCYFSTLAQCQASVSGVGGFCRINGFYDGRPVRPPDGYAYDAPRRKHRHSRG
jgi:uncharacterized protein DUF3551